MRWQREHFFPVRLSVLVFSPAFRCLTDRPRLSCGFFASDVLCLWLREKRITYYLRILSTFYIRVTSSTISFRIRKIFFAATSVWSSGCNFTQKRKKRNFSRISFSSVFLIWTSSTSISALRLFEDCSSVCSSFDYSLITIRSHLYFNTILSSKWNLIFF